ncbi:MAG: hypothetical protein EXS64_14875 [Candidatus Latescibacteria bacterium]|nr:hypothetical protein [Candidatus Latescibacterota bacterium]
MASQRDVKRKAEYVEAVTRGEGWMPWQRREPVSEEERTFRQAVERRKGRMLAERDRVRHPVLMTGEVIDRIEKNSRSAPWARQWLGRQRQLADHIVGQPEGFIERMLTEETPLTRYTFTCPRCIGVKSQEGTDGKIIQWDPLDPDRLRCGACGQVYPDPKYPELARLEFPRRGRTLTYYLNDRERRHPKDRSGRLAYPWGGHPIHVSFSGMIREYKTLFMIGAIRPLALMHRFTGRAEYAEACARVMLRLSHCFNAWLYHDYWDAVADCDPLYAAWHDRSLPIAWKRCLFTSVYEKDTLESARMMQTYWGAGRVHTSTGSITSLIGVCEAYDLIHDARRSDGRPLWTPEMRETVERDLILEWIIEAEPFVGGRGRTKNVTNKAPRIYHTQAVVAKLLGIPDLADTAIRGYEAIRDHSFGGDGASHESPAYTSMFLHELLQIPEALHGFRWPKSYARRRGTVDLYRTDPALRRMLRTSFESLRPDGRLMPVSDTIESSVKGSGSRIYEVAMKRFPADFADKTKALYAIRGSRPTDYAIEHLDIRAFGKTGRKPALDPPEVYFPDWMTPILRHGSGTRASYLVMPFNPPGGHRHYDNLNLSYFDRGQTVLGDQGYLSSCPVQRWIRSTFSHNLVLVDDQPQRFTSGVPRCPEFRMMVTSPRVSVVEAASDCYDACREYRRLVALIKGPDAQTFAVDIFRVKGGSSHDYRIFSELAASDSPAGSLSFQGLDLPPEPPLPEVGASMKPEDIFGLRDLRTDRKPSSAWQAVWRQRGRSYRLWMLSACDAVQASNGPGQERWEEQGRRVRYVDALRAGKDLESTFVAVHEPSGPGGTMPIRRVVRLEVPEQAGPDAVAVRIESRWGTYRVFSDFRRKAEVDGVRFEGKFGIACETPEGKVWWLACGAKTLKEETGKEGRSGSGREGGAGFGFEGASATWSDSVSRQTGDTLFAAKSHPPDWYGVPDDLTAYVVLRAGKYLTGYPVKAVGGRRIVVDGFPLPKVRRFELMAVRTGERK